ncbi:glucokinase [Nonomuraea muscovyensis]|uniref:glucokinase n=1 Tax=Nonomuraea muscovyensis TaxID=1124761 RepID=UPI0033E95B61
MSALPYPWLVADIGGTNARFGLVTGPGARPSQVAVLAGAEHRTLPDAVAAYLAEHADGGRPGAACLAVAGPVEGDRYTLTNLPWAGSARDLGVPNATLLNDFEALALSLPHLDGDDLVPIGGPGGPGAGPVPGPGVKAVLGPGTGLGVAGLVPVGSGWLPIASEGGHVSVPVQDDRELEVLRVLRAQARRSGRPGSPAVTPARTPAVAPVHGEADQVVAERVLSGPGLVRLHRALAEVNGVTAPELAASDIVARQDDPLCAETIEVFCGMLGSFAANVALTLGARGGVYLGGGVLPRIVERVCAGDFRARFTANPDMSGYLDAIATMLIVAPQPALTGAAAWLARQSAGQSTTMSTTVSTTLSTTVSTTTSTGTSAAAPAAASDAPAAGAAPGGLTTTTATP